EAGGQASGINNRLRRPTPEETAAAQSKPTQVLPADAANVRILEPGAPLEAVPQGYRLTTLRGAEGQMFGVLHPSEMAQSRALALAEAEIARANQPPSSAETTKPAAQPTTANVADPQADLAALGNLLAKV